jgi:hypothetical protein
MPPAGKKVAMSDAKGIEAEKNDGQLAALISESTLI